MNPSSITPLLTLETLNDGQRSKLDRAASDLATLLERLRIVGEAKTIIVNTKQQVLADLAQAEAAAQAGDSQAGTAAYGYRDQLPRLDAKLRNLEQALRDILYDGNILWFETVNHLRAASLPLVDRIAAAIAERITPFFANADYAKGCALESEPVVRLSTWCCPLKGKTELESAEQAIAIVEALSGHVAKLLGGKELVKFQPEGG